jgi:hypothetical protein
MSRYYLRSRDLNVEDLANKNEKAKGGLKRKAGGDQEDEATCPKKCMVEVNFMKHIRAKIFQALIDSTSELELDPAPHFDYDKENANNPYAVAEFAWDIFRYYKHREAKFRLGGYSSKDFGQHDRAKAVDYMVQVRILPINLL